MKMSFVDRESKHVRGRIVYDMLVGVYGGDGRSNLRLLYKFELDQPHEISYRDVYKYLHP